MLNDCGIQVDGDQGGQLVDAGSFFTIDLSGALTHLTADIAFFTSLSLAESDYRKWKSVFNVIQGFKEMKYFVCVREKKTVLGKFSSWKPLSSALTAVLSVGPRKRREMMDLNWLDDILSTSAPVEFPELLSSSSSITSRSDFEPKGTSLCHQMWKKLCCLKNVH